MKSLAALLVLFSFQAAHAADIKWNSCSVVEVGPAGNYVLEEGLGSIYDLDWAGNVNTDGDSTGASVAISEKEIKLSLGQGDWNSKDDKITRKTFTYDSENTSEEAEGQEIAVEAWGGVITWRIFPDYKVAIVKFTGSKYKNEHLATVDCKSGGDVRYR